MTVEPRCWLVDLPRAKLRLVRFSEMRVGAVATRTGRLGLVAARLGRLGRRRR